MKKFAIILTLVATLGGNAAFAQTGKGAANAKNAANDDFAWLIGLGGLAVIGTVVGITVAAALHDTSSFSH